MNSTRRKIEIKKWTMDVFSRETKQYIGMCTHTTHDCQRNGSNELKHSIAICFKCYVRNMTKLNAAQL